ncbi:MAG: hypothetical protein WA791_10385, partial [Rhodomicrobium sp.]
MMTKAKFILTALVIIVATVWGAAQQANAIFTSPGSGSRGSGYSSHRASNWQGQKTTTHHTNHK